MPDCIFDEAPQESALKVEQNYCGCKINYAYGYKEEHSPDDEERHYGSKSPSDDSKEDVTLSELLYRRQRQDSNFTSLDQNGLESEEKGTDYDDCWVGHSCFDP